jgi:hypothetical protein
MAYKMDKYLISRLNVANSEFYENGVMRKIPHGDFEKLAGMHLFSCFPRIILQRETNKLQNHYQNAGMIFSNIDKWKLEHVYLDIFYFRVEEFLERRPETWF